ncbi:MAG: replication-associated recombination protein A, partial [Gammaproteobacteria bacterium]
HRFNKSQQDAFLPFVEDGTIIFIGSTTENPSFALNNALLSRARVYVLKRLLDADLLMLIQRCLQQSDPIDFPEALQIQLAQSADGDARACINSMEIALQLASLRGAPLSIDEEILQQVLTEGVRRFDKQGEEFYDQISALHKAVRGSSPDAALYWLARMIDGGCDLQYLARRIVRMASEDIGNADPRGLEIALNAWQVYDRLGSPEGELALAQAVVYLAVAAKSNAVYTAFQQAMAEVKKHGSLPVPLHLRNAPTKLMRNLEYGKAYRYAHDEAHGYAAGENYFPEEMSTVQYYKPVDRGLEQKIKEKLAWLCQLDQERK